MEEEEEVGWGGGGGGLIPQFTLCNNITWGCVLKTAVLKIFIIFAEKCPWESLLKEVSLCRLSISLNKAFRQIWFLTNLRNIQHDWQ